MFSDSWKQSIGLVQRKPGESDDNYAYRRLRFSYHRTAQAVFNTSFTTATAFIATSMSPIMPISAFGYFSSLAILVNYIFVCSLTPAAIITRHIHFEHLGFLGIFKKVTTIDYLSSSIYLISISTYLLVSHKRSNCVEQHGSEMR